MEIVPVKTGRPYEIHIEPGLLDRCGEEAARATAARRCCLITDTVVRDLYAGRVKESLERAGFEVLVYAFPAGEASKTLRTYGEILEFLAKNRLNRGDCIAALGGGVTGDMAGFAAATYLRGIDYLQIPTTLLAQVDSSVGGKTALDLEAGKNLVGAFYQPALVLMDPDTLTTLPDRTFSDGMAEVIKYGCIWNRAFYELLAAHPSRGEIMDRIGLVLKTCCAIKAQVVAEDERDRGIRVLLNFGHTMGHAYELAGSYEKWTHGQGVAAGMMAALALGVDLGLTDPAALWSLPRLLEAFDLPVSLPCTRDQAAQAVGLDKKGDGEEITMVLLREIGRSFPHRMKKEEVLRCLEPLWRG